MVEDADVNLAPREHLILEHAKKPHLLRVEILLDDPSVERPTHNLIPRWKLEQPQCGPNEVDERHQGLLVGISQICLIEVELRLIEACLEIE